MMSHVRSSGLFTAVLAATAIAGPVVIREPNNEVSVLQERIPSIPLGSYSLSTTHQNDVLFNIGVSTSSGNVGESFNLEVECVDCRTWGTAVISTSGVNKNDDIIGDIISFFKNPVDTIVEAFDLDVKIDFENVGGHFDFNILAADTVSYSFPIFTSETPVGCAVSDEVSVGLVLSIDLVFSLTAEIDLEAGFEFSFPEGAYITVDPLSGDIVDQGFAGGQVDHLPITCKSGSATFKAALRVRVQAGTTVELFGTGFDFELGVYADLIEYIATIGTSDQCELYITESVDVNIGAYAHAVVEIDYKSFGVNPAVVTTLLDYPLPSLCLTRPAITSVSAFPTTVPVSEVTSGITTGTSAIPTSSGAASTVPLSSEGASNSSEATSTSSPIIPSSTSSTPGGVFQQSSLSSTSSPASYTPSASPIPYSNSTTTSSSILGSSPTSSSGSILTSSPTITSAPLMTTSTVVSTSLITITSCSSTVLHCPGSLTSEFVLTSTIVLYTTVCPVGEVQPTTFLSSASVSSTFGPTITLSPSGSPAGITGGSTNTPSPIASPFSLTPYATPVVETIYTPTFVNPTYTMPTATIFTVPFPNWNVSSTVSTLAGGASTITLPPTSTPLNPIKVVTSTANSTTVVATGSLKPTSPIPFTGTGSRLGGNMVFGSFVVVAIGVWGLL